MRLPTRFSVGVRAYLGNGARDAHGNAVDGWAAPVLTPVYAIAPTTSTEPDPARLEVVTGLTVLAPPGTKIGPNDRIDIDGLTYEVVGEIADWGRGPFGFNPGISVNVQRVEG